MKTAGVLFTIDLLRTLYTGFANVRQEKKEESERLEVIKKTEHPSHWKPYVIGILLISGAFLVLGKKK